MADQIAALGTKAIIIGPDTLETFQRFWAEHQLPFIGIPDPSGLLLADLKQEITWWRLGRMPAAQLLDQTGVVRWSHSGKSMKDLPTNTQLLAEIQRVCTDVSARKVPL